jgi:hypothetical protein
VTGAKLYCTYFVPFVPLLSISLSHSSPTLLPFFSHECIHLCSLIQVGYQSALHCIAEELMGRGIGWGLDGQTQCSVRQPQRRAHGQFGFFMSYLTLPLFPASHCFSPLPAYYLNPHSPRCRLVKRKWSSFCIK